MSPESCLPLGDTSNGDKRVASVSVEVRTVATVTGSEARFVGLPAERLLIPYPIRAWSEDPDLPFDVELEIDDGGTKGMVCVALTARRRAGGPPVTSAAVGRLPVRQLVAEAVRHAAVGEWDPATGAVTVTSDSYRQAARAEVAPALRAGRTRAPIVKPEQYPEAAKVYRRAARAHARGDGPAPVNALRDRFSLARPTAYKLRNALRAGGYLKETE